MADTSIQNSSTFVRATGICLGLALPAFLIGKAALGILIALAILGVFVLSGRQILAAWRAFATRPEGRIYAGIAAVFLISVLLSGDVAQSFETWLRAAILLPLGLALVSALRETPALLDVALKALIGGAIIVLLLAAYFLYVDKTPLYRFGLAIGETIEAGNFFLPMAAVMACCIPIFAWAGQRFSGAWRIAAFGAIPLTLMAIWGNGMQPNIAAMGGLIGGLLFLGALVVMDKMPRWMVAATLGVSILAAIVLAALFLEALPAPATVTSESAGLPGLDWHRQVIWGFAYDVLKSNWLTGVGLNTIADVPGAKVIVPDLNQEFIPSHPHNWVLEIGAEAGIVGLIAAFVGLATAVVGAARYRAHGAAWAILFVIGIYWISSLANFSVWSAWWNTVLVICLSLLWGAIPRGTLR